MGGGVRRRARTRYRSGVAAGEEARIPVVAFVGRSGVGKTTLIGGIVRALRSRGLRVGAIKHSRGFDDPDRPGKDSQLLREAGADRLVLAGPQLTVLFWSHAGCEPSFAQRMDLLGRDLDLVLVESYRSADLPTVEVLRRGHSDTLGFARSAPRLAVAADFTPPGLDVPLLPLGDPDAVAAFLVERLRLRPAAPP